MNITPPRSMWCSYLCALFAAFLWSSDFVGIRVGLTELAPSTLAFWRHVVASLAILPFYLTSSRAPLPRGRGLLGLIAAGMLGIGGYNLLLNTAQLVVNAAISSFIISQIPVLTVLLAWWFLDEPLNRKGWLSLVVSIVGISLVALYTHPDHHTSYTLPLWLGLLALLGAVLAGAGYSVLVKPLLQHVKPIQLTAIMLWSGTLMLMPFGWHGFSTLVHAHSTSLMTIVYLGVFPGCLAYVAWSLALCRLSTSQACSMLYTVPLITLVMAYTILDETAAPMALAGGVIAVLGALMMSAWAQPTIEA